MRTRRLIIHQTKHPDHKNSDFEFTAAEELIHSGKAHLTEAERTLAEDALAEGNDFYGAARRAGRRKDATARRAGAKNIGVQSCG